MPLPELILDNRRYNDLVGGLRDLVPGQSTNWNDFNPPDPAITLMEMWCWIADMLLYRINRVSDRSQTNFLKLVLDPPEPVTAEVTLRILPQLLPIVIPPGTRFQAMVSPPDILEFETFSTTIAGQNISPPAIEDVTFPVRSRIVVTNEFLGISNGDPDQLFQLKQGPVLTDANNVGILTTDYNPNPLIAVSGGSGAAIWTYVPDFLSPATGPTSEQFIVEKLTGKVRFGNGVRAAIPPAGASVTALRYQILKDREVRIGADTLVLIDPISGLASSDILEVHNRAAEGGEYIYTSDKAKSVGLPLFEEEWRAITSADFSVALVEQFNRLQDSIPNPPGPADLVERMFIVPGKDLQGTAPFPVRIGAISVVIMPKAASSSDVLLIPSAALLGKVRRFLDARRLITTRLLVVGPNYVPLTLSIEVAGEPGIDSTQVATAIDAQLRSFFHPLTGGDQGAGWPVGRDIHKSELYQQVESVEGVDFVRRILINGDPSRMTVELNENELPVVMPLPGQIPVSITT